MSEYWSVVALSTAITTGFAALLGLGACVAQWAEEGGWLPPVLGALCVAAVILAWSYAGVA